ncbi:uncharacterized protein LOC109825063 isoform X2 [Asparagus officinalis]|nr:uncharacterized protein LOC109825063 isoform X2 [Asparagus officinalis]XP_020247378.1 uncharacterized protein LOC109825063 isoform X2 [Asparagus officinalis]
MASSDLSKSAKPEKFTGLNYKRWANQMKYWLTTLGLISAIDSDFSLSTPTPSSSSQVEPIPTPTTSSGISKSPEEINFHCYNRILSALSDKLYDIYYEYKDAKELWVALESEYGLDDAGIERFSSSSFNKFVMVDSKPINDQLHEFQDYIRYLQSKGNTFSEEYKVSSLIDKLPPSWSDFAKDLRHLQGDLTLVQALKGIRIEDQHRQNSKPKNEMKAKVNLVEEKPKNFRNPNHKPKGKNFKKKNLSHRPNQHPNLSRNHKPFSQKSETKFCYVCGRTNHLSTQCYYRKKAPIKTHVGGKGEEASHRVNMVENNSDSFRLASSSYVVNCTTFSDDWWLDSGANIHISSDRSWFSTYQ